MNLDKDFYVVGIGASAGGLEAIEQFFSKVPVDCGLAFVIIQHLSPDYISLMPEILLKRTTIKVHTAEDGMEVLPNNIYLIPRKMNMKIFNAKLHLSEKDNLHSLNLPIDIFFNSVAEDFGSKAIAIILSGTGSDGSRGIRTVKDLGGCVIAQDPESAKFDGMPRSAISTGIVDFVLKPEDMPDKLISFVQHPYSKDNEATLTLTSNDEDILNHIILLIKDEFGHDFTYYKSSTIVRRLERRLTINQIDNLRDYLNYLYTSKNELRTLYKEFLIGVTKFFRDIEAFQFLEEDVIPEIFKSKSPKEDIRVWVGGCSTGEEAYSIAILFREYIINHHLEHDVKIFATDVDKSAIEYASNGIYSASISADVSPDRLNRFFSQAGDSYKVHSDIREMIVFASHNISKDPPFNKIDLLTCRNLLIYFQTSLQQKVLALFHFALNTNGFLFLGSSESIGDLGHYFDVCNNKWKIFKCKQGRKLSYNNLADKPPFNLKATNTQRITPGIQNRPVRNDISSFFSKKLLEDNVPETVVVNEDFEIVNTYGDIKKFIDFPKVIDISSAMRLNICDMVPESLRLTFSLAINKVFKTQANVVHQNIKYKRSEIETQMVDIRFSPFSISEQNVMLVVIYFTENKHVLFTKEDQLVSQNIDQLAKQRINVLEYELKHTKENLQASIEELETTNEELQSTNEELISSNEELQSTNEELQSVNEELYTVNTEFQAKNHDLVVINNDMENLLQHSEIRVIFLDNELKIRRFTDSIREIINLKDNDEGRPISDITHNLKNVDLQKIAYQVIEKPFLYQQQVRSLDKWFLMKFLPYKTKENFRDGVVITFIDITDLMKAQELIHENDERYKLAQRVVKFGNWDWDLVDNQLYWSEQIFEMFGLEPNEFNHTLESFLERIYPDDKDFVIRSIERTLANQSEYDINHRIVKKNGAVVWVNETAEIVRNALGKPIRMVGIIRDINHRVETDIKLARSEQNYRLLFENMINGFVLHEVISNELGDIIDFRYTEINQGFEDIISIPRKEVVGKTIRQLFPKLEGIWLETFSNVVKTGHPALFEEFAHPLNKYFRVYAYSPNKQQLITIFDDITQSKLSEINIQKTKNRLDFALEVGGLAWWEWNVETGIVEFADNKLKMLNYKANEIKPNIDQFIEMIHPDDRQKANEAMRNHLEGKIAHYEAEYRIRTKDGNYRWFFDRGTVSQRSETGKPMFVSGIVYDISYKK